MKLTARASDLVDALRFAASALEKRNTIPILYFLLVEAAHDVVMRGTDLDVDATARCPADVGESGSLTVSARIADLIEALPGDATVTLTCTGDSTSFMTVRSGRSSYRVPTRPVTEFPAPLRAGPDACEFTLSAGDVVELFGRPAFAMSDERTRYYLTGIFLHLLDDVIVAVATDGRRLGRVTLPTPAYAGVWPKDGGRPGVIVPAKACGRIIRLGAEARFRISNRIIECHTETRSIGSKLIDGTYPDYARVLPTNRTGTAELDRRDLVSAITRLNAVLDPKDKILPVVRLMWADGTDAIELDLPRLADTASDLIAAETSGSGVIPVTIQMLAELLQQFKNKRVRIAASGKAQPITVTAPDDPNFYTIVMPVTV